MTDGADEGWTEQCRTNITSVRALKKPLVHAQYTNVN